MNAECGRRGHCTHLETDPTCQHHPQAIIHKCCRCGAVTDIIGQEVSPPVRSPRMRESLALESARNLGWLPPRET